MPSIAAAGVIAGMMEAQAISLMFAQAMVQMKANETEAAGKMAETASKGSINAQKNVGSIGDTASSRT